MYRQMAWTASLTTRYTATVWVSDEWLGEGEAVDHLGWSPRPSTRATPRPTVSRGRSSESHPAKSEEEGQGVRS